MPIYEYQCSNHNCGLRIEQLQKITDAALTLCPACKTESLTRLVSAAGFRLKGGGWYETDFKGEKDKRKNLSSDNSNNTHTCQSNSCCAKAATSATTTTTNSNVATE